MLPKSLHVLNEGLAFFLEIVALVLLAYWGFHVGSDTAVQWLLGLGAPAVMIVVWGTFAAPRARVKLPLAGVMAVKLVVFVAATAAGYAAGWQAFSIVFGVVALANALLAAFDRESLIHQSRSGADS